MSNNAKVVTRFAPSPTGFLHIGGARTALFNYLFAKRHGGTYKLRIEDTDTKRSTQQATDAILDGLGWLGLLPDDNHPTVYQSQNANRHAEIAHKLLESGHAYKCYCTPDELDEMRKIAREQGRPTAYNRRWRDRPDSEAPTDVPPVIRIKMPTNGQTTLNDLVQGTVTTPNEQLDDFIILRADGTPTYMLSVVVDDHDMDVTHVIRGDDHLTNAFRQYHLYQACGWDVPEFAHIPLIHGPDGAKLSKRHGALGVDVYRDELGYLPTAINNYLLRLGWSHGDDEIISHQQAQQWFDLSGVGKSPSRFDYEKLDSLNAHYMTQTDNAELVALITPQLPPLTPELNDRLIRGMDGLKPRVKTLCQLVDSCQFYIQPVSYPLTEKSAKMMNADSPALCADIAKHLATLSQWNAETIGNALKSYAESQGVGFGKIGQPVRGAVSGTPQSPDLAEMLAVFGRDETLNRLKSVPQNPVETAP